MNTDIEQAILNLRATATKYAKSERYYNGDHDLAFATEKFQNTFGTLFREFALNLCPVICDAVRDKLRVTGFTVDSAGPQAPLPARRDSVLNSASHRAANAGFPGLTSAARSIWNRNRMGTRAGEIHKEALKCGDAYMIVWPDTNGRSVMYLNRAANITVAYDEESPGRILWAAKTWSGADKFVRLNIFYPDRIEKYISKAKVEGTLPEANGFEPFADAERARLRDAEIEPSDGRVVASPPRLALSASEAV